MAHFFFSILLAFAPCPAAQDGRSPVEVPAGTLLSVELVDEISTAKNEAGQPFRARLLEDVWTQGRRAIPAGAAARGEIVEAVGSGRIKGTAKMTLRLNSLQVDASAVPIVTDILSYTGEKHAGKNIGAILSGALQGLFFGILLGGGDGAAIGSAAGAGAGAVKGLITGKNDLTFQQGARLIFELTAPVEVLAPPPGPAVEKQEQAPAAEKKDGRSAS